MPLTLDSLTMTDPGAPPLRRGAPRTLPAVSALTRLATVEPHEMAEVKGLAAYLTKLATDGNISAAVRGMAVLTLHRLATAISPEVFAEPWLAALDPTHRHAAWPEDDSSVRLIQSIGARMAPVADRLAQRVLELWMTEDRICGLALPLTVGLLQSGAGGTHRSALAAGALERLTEDPGAQEREIRIYELGTALSLPERALLSDLARAAFKKHHSAAVALLPFAEASRELARALAEAYGLTTSLPLAIARIPIESRSDLHAVITGIARWSTTPFTAAELSAFCATGDETVRLAALSMLSRLPASAARLDQRAAARRVGR